MAKVVLISPPYLTDYMRNARCDFVSLSKTQWYPILLGYCGAYLEKLGHTVKFIDGPAQNLSMDDATAMIRDFKPDLTVIYSGRLSEDSDASFADSIIEKTGAQAVFVGAYASIEPAKTLAKSRFAKFAVKGEFEKPVAEILNGSTPKDIKNLAWKDSAGAITENPVRPLLTGEELDEFPFLTEFFSLHIDPRLYRTPSEPYPFMDILTGRGCAWGICTYCLWVHSFIPGKVYNCRSPKSVAEEFAYVSKNIPSIRHIMIQDDTLTEERATELSEALIKADTKISWSCYARGNLAYDVMALMKRAGCLNLHVGYETPDKAILKNIKKGLSREIMTKFTADAKRAGLHIHGDFAIGFPGETRQTAMDTIEWACSIRPHTAQFQLMIPFPGTPFYTELEEKGWIKDGAPNYPELSKEEMEGLAKLAYKKFYISPPYFLYMLRHPYSTFLSKMPTYFRALSYVMGGKYVR